MANQNNDIEKYLRGELSPAEMHALEKKALQDPFLAEALEGAQHVGHENFSLDLELIQKSVHEKTKKKGLRIISLTGWSLYTGVAAGLLLLVASSFAILIMIKQQNEGRGIATPNKTPGLTENTEAKKGLRSDSLIAQNKPSASKTLGIEIPKSSRIQQAPPKEKSSNTNASPTLPVINEEYAQDRELEIEVEAELQEPPIIVDERARADEGDKNTKKKALAFSKKSSPATTLPPGNERIVHGKVIHEGDGQFLPGVNVIVKGTTKGAVSDVNGDFQIPVSDTEKTLVFNFIGLTTQEINIENNTSLNVVMKDDITALSEVVVTGYATNSTGEAEREVYEMAFPEGGRRAFNKYLETNLQYPEVAKQNKIEGRVTVQFTVKQDGTLSDFKVIKGIGYGCDEELIRLIQQGPAWNPSKRNNERVTEKVKVRLRFKLPD
ncbi:energy transducer TonB [Chryseosolibacter indicus]|uniref:TonB family protein n=1 Tax=Chryseosolibacter indicus TaxID=2782351 RepID=A0ABS5VVW9_9BACT|nr:TonB family protein [Chryseosolibacter indicus]MBT1705572.1 TonB family protein [Chryseosolibacter indicus]